MCNEKLDTTENVAKQDVHIILVIDNSGSMQGRKIHVVNNAIRNSISAIIEAQKFIDNVTIKLSAMVFSDDTKWLYTEPQVAENFKWKDITVEGGSNLSAAFDELARYLCKKENGGQMSDLDNVAPFIVLITDGMPTSSDWESRLTALWQNDRFKTAYKFAFTFDKMYDELVKFTGMSNTVHYANTGGSFCESFPTLFIAASYMASEEVARQQSNPPKNGDCQES